MKTRPKPEMRKVNNVIKFPKKQFSLTYIKNVSQDSVNKDFDSKLRLMLDKVEELNDQLEEQTRRLNKLYSITLTLGQQLKDLEK